MTKLLKTGQAGTVESTDIFVAISPADPGTGVKIELVSPTMQQYGEHIINLITKILTEQDIFDAVVHANEKGAMDYTIEARVKTAIARAIV
ncbi:citrate lyase acyl carrier protein [Pelosinus sp. sgz500959]|uniref:citrate lyase acyl carrier protein n=1 Tax=Pelosinus sp. sgz500959 TaxID=3242472 RepID=UPI00366CC2CC